MYDIVEEFDSESGYNIQRLRVLKQIPTARFGILVGDVVHQARAAFDNLVEILNIRKTGKPMKRTEFPLYSNRDEFLLGRKGQRAGIAKCGKVGDGPLTLIKSLQPYLRGDDYVSDPLWILNELWSMDKHRNPPVVASLVRHESVKPQWRATSGTATITPRDLIVPTIFPYVDGTEISRHNYEMSLNAEMYVQRTFSVHISFGADPPGLRGREVTPTLLTCVEYAARALAQFEKFF
ncbi:MAG: hypothetical protein IIA92_01025 [Chloroflexi bacterium]|nr:hypothetical protein [Chloroflexota bacterium]